MTVFAGRCGPNRRPPWSALAAVAGSLLFTSANAKEMELVIDSVPRGARIEFKGNAIGTTPYTVSYPKNYFDGPQTVLSKRLAEPVVVTLYVDGYYPKTVELTHGPFLWQSLNGANVFMYYLLDTSYHIILDPLPGVPASPAAGSGPVTSTGTGFHVFDLGYVATNFHVVDDATEITVGQGNGCPASVFASDKANDLVVLRIDADCVGGMGLGAPLILGSTTELGAGEEVVTFGFPLSGEFGDEPQVSTGIVKSTAGLDADPRTLTISNSIQPGNSGGPLFGPDGRVVAVVTSTMNVNYLYPRYEVIPQELNFAVRAEYLNLLFQMKGLKLTTAEDVQPPNSSESVSDRAPSPSNLPEFLKSIRTSVVLVRARKAAEPNGATLPR